MYVLPSMAANSGSRPLVAVQRSRAVAAVMLGRAKPVGVAAACALFGFCDSVGLRLQGEGLPNQITDSAPYVATLLALIVAGLRQRFRVLPHTEVSRNVS